MCLKSTTHFQISDKFHQNYRKSRKFQNYFAVKNVFIFIFLYLRLANITQGSSKVVHIRTMKTIKKIDFSYRYIQIWTKYGLYTKQYNIMYIIVD